MVHLRDHVGGHRRLIFKEREREIERPDYSSDALVTISFLLLVGMASTLIAMASNLLASVY